MSDRLSERQAALVVGAALSTVQNRVRAGLLPESAHQDDGGRWWLDPSTLVAEWAASEPLRAGQDEAGDTLQAWREARTRREAAQAAMAEDELRKRRGELLEAAGVENRLVAVFSECRTKLLGIPSRLRQRCPNLTQADLAEVEAEIREALEALADGRVTDGN